MVKHGKLTFEYNKILPSIFIGTNQCCVMHFKTELIKKGILADLSLESEKLDSAFGVKYFLWLPVKDHTAPKMKQFILGVSFLKHCVNNGLKVYAHCERGHGRAPTMVAAYLCSVKGMHPREAVAFIKKRRPGVHPNKNQMAALTRYWRFARKHPSKAH